MSTKDKLIERFKLLPSDFTFDELKHVMNLYGFHLINLGATSGSRLGFIKGNRIIKMHKPHPGKIVGRKTLKAIYNEIKDIKLQWED